MQQVTLKFLQTNITLMHFYAQVDDIYNQDTDTTWYMILTLCSMDNHWWIRTQILLHNLVLETSQTKHGNKNAKA